jgi:hypothetical protein
LRSGGDLSLNGEMREKCLDFRSPHRAQMPPSFVSAVEAKEGHDPQPVCLLDAAREVSTTEDRDELLVERGSHRRRPYHPIRRSRQGDTLSLQDHAQSRSAENRRTCEARVLR